MKVIWGIFFYNSAVVSEILPREIKYDPDFCFRTFIGTVFKILFTLPINQGRAFHRPEARKALLAFLRKIANQKVHKLFLGILNHNKCKLPELEDLSVLSMGKNRVFV